MYLKDRDHYIALFTAGGRGDIEDDQRFRSRRGRFENSDSLYRDVAAILTTRSTNEWLAFCVEHAFGVLDLACEHPPDQTSSQRCHPCEDANARPVDGGEEAEYEPRRSNCKRYERARIHHVE